MRCLRTLPANPTWIRYGEKQTAIFDFVSSASARNCRALASTVTQLISQPNHDLAQPDTESPQSASASQSDVKTSHEVLPITVLQIERLSYQHQTYMIQQAMSFILKLHVAVMEHQYLRRTLG